MLVPQIGLSDPAMLGARLGPESPNRETQDAEAAKQLEGMFASVLIKTMRQTLGEDGLFPGDKADILGTLFDQHMGEEIARSGGLGVASRLHL